MEDKDYCNIKWAENDLEKALSKAKKNTDLHYYYAVLKMSQHQYSQALQECVKTIEYADEALARDYFAKGLCEACLDMFKEALEDFSVAIKLDSEFLDAYFLKGKCSYISGDPNDAFDCYQQLIMMQREDPVMYIHAGNLLMSTGAIEDAIRAFNNANEIQKTDIAFYQQAKVNCYLIHSVVLWMVIYLTPSKVLKRQ